MSIERGFPCGGEHRVVQGVTGYERVVTAGVKDEAPEAPEELVVPEIDVDALANKGVFSHEYIAKALADSAREITVKSFVIPRERAMEHFRGPDVIEGDETLP